MSSNTTQKNIFQLVLDGDLEGVRDYFSNDAHDVNRILIGATPLHVTAYSNDPAKIHPSLKNSLDTMPIWKSQPALDETYRT